MAATKQLTITAVALAVTLWAPIARCAFKLSADEAPVDPPWSQPANLSVVREGGTNTVTADFLLQYQSKARRYGDAAFAADGSYGVGIFLHRDNTPTARRNDRGLQLSYSGLLVPNLSNAGPVVRMGYSLKAKTGKALVEVDQPDGSKALVDKTKNRIVLALGGYLLPAMSGEPTPGVIPPIRVFFDGGPSLYLDESRGNGVPGNGRITGTQLKLGFNYAPLGHDPLPVKGLTMFPTLRLAAQVQSDISASGTRTRMTRKLYSLELNLLFDRPETETDKLVPSIQLSRSVGADVLTGRAQAARTELMLGLSF